MRGRDKKELPRRGGSSLHLAGTHTQLRKPDPYHAAREAEGQPPAGGIGGAPAAGSFGRIALAFGQLKKSAANAADFFAAALQKDPLASADRFPRSRGAVSLL